MSRGSGNNVQIIEVELNQQGSQLFYYWLVRSHQPVIKLAHWGTGCGGVGQHHYSDGQAEIFHGAQEFLCMLRFNWRKLNRDRVSYLAQIPSFFDHRGLLMWLNYFNNFSFTWINQSSFSDKFYTEISFISKYDFPFLLYIIPRKVCIIWQSQELEKFTFA
jgi:hypothetical protein